MIASIASEARVWHCERLADHVFGGLLASAHRRWRCFSQSYINIYAARVPRATPSLFTHDCYPHMCPCGWYGDAKRVCVCSPAMVTCYQKRIAGLLLDRFDIHVEVPRVNYEKLTSMRLGEPSAAIRACVQLARDRQSRRFPLAHAHSNAEMGPAELRAHCQLDGAGQ